MDSLKQKNMDEIDIKNWRSGFSLSRLLSNISCDLTSRHRDPFASSYLIYGSLPPRMNG